MDELYVLARAVLLDALEALGGHREAVVVVGAQAVYLRVGEVGLVTAPYTTDADLAIDPAMLSDTPPLERALTAAGFSPKSSETVGVWITHRKTSHHPTVAVAVDLLVPLSVSPGMGRRAAKLPGHDARAARMVRGLEGALVDVDVLTLTALDPRDVRAIQVKVAGPAALLTAKLHKIDERQGGDRSIDKDALDVFRLLRGTSTAGLAERYQRMLDDDRAREPATVARELLGNIFARREGPGIEMLVRSLGSSEDPAQVSASCLTLARDLLGALRDL